MIPRRKLTDWVAVAVACLFAIALSQCVTAKENQSFETKLALAEDFDYQKYICEKYYNREYICEEYRKWIRSMNGHLALQGRFHGLENWEKVYVSLVDCIHKYAMNYITSKTDLWHYTGFCVGKHTEMHNLYLYREKR